MQRPNIIFIVADDLGFADLGCYGGRDAAFGPVSPVLDGLAAKGIRFTQGYANSPVCSPTRFALMTARYQYRLRGAAEEPINSKSRGSTTLGLPPEHPTLPSLLRDAGYRTALIGKWHLGYPPAFGPLRSGYEEFFGPMSGGVDYFTPLRLQPAATTCGRARKTGRKRATSPTCSRAAQSTTWSAWRASEAPFFLSLHYTAPHWPWETREDEGRGAGGEEQPLRPGRRQHPHLPPHDPSHGRGHRLDHGRAARSRASPTTRWSSSPATTAASASPTTGRWSAARWT